MKQKTLKKKLMGMGYSAKFLDSIIRKLIAQQRLKQYSHVWIEDFVTYNEIYKLFRINS